MANRPTILVSDDGLPLCVYVQKDGDEILRKVQVLYLKSMGAVIMEDVKYAYVIIILDLKLRSAMELIQDYGDAPGAPALVTSKIVLKYQWIEACLTASSRIPWDDYRIRRQTLAAVEEEGSASRLRPNGEQLAPNPPSRDNDQQGLAHGRSPPATVPSVPNLLARQKSKPSNETFHASTNDSTLKRKRLSNEQSEQKKSDSTRVGSSHSRNKSPEPGELEAVYMGPGYRWTEAEEDFLIAYAEWGFKNGMTQIEIARRAERKLKVTDRRATTIYVRISQLKRGGRLASGNPPRQTTNRSTLLSSIPSKKRRLEMSTTPEDPVESSPAPSSPLVKPQEDLLPEEDDHDPPNPPDPSTFESSTRHGYTYTEADRQFFAKYANWYLRQNPETSLTNLARGAADLATHHSEEGWRWHIRIHRSEYLKRVPRLKHIVSKGKAVGGDVANDQEDSQVAEHVEKRRFTDDERWDMAAFLAQHPHIWYSEKRPVVPDEEPLSRQGAWDLFDELHPHYQRTKNSWETYHRRHTELLEQMAWTIAKGKHASSRSLKKHHSNCAVPAATKPMGNQSGAARHSDTESTDTPWSRKESYTIQDWDDLVDYLANHPALMTKSPDWVQGSATKGELWDRFARKHPGHSSTSWRQYYWSRQEALDTEAVARMKAPGSQVRERDSVIYIYSDEEAEVSAGPSKRRIRPASPSDGGSSDIAVEDLVDEMHVGRRKPSSTTGGRSATRLQGRPRRF